MLYKRLSLRVCVGGRDGMTVQSHCDTWVHSIQPVAASTERAKRTKIDPPAVDLNQILNRSDLIVVSLCFKMLKTCLTPSGPHKTSL